MQYLVVKQGLFTKEILGIFDNYHPACDWWEQVGSQIEGNSGLWHSYRVEVVVAGFHIAFNLRRGVVDFFRVFTNEHVI